MKLATPKWHFTYLRWGEKFLAGAAVPGMFINSYARADIGAYGTTAMNADVSDIFVEQVKDGKYLFEGEWHDLEERTETFKIRGMGEKKHTYYYTKNGPLLEPFQGDGAKLVVWFDPKFTKQNLDSSKRYSIKWSYSTYDFNVNSASTYKKGMYAENGGKEMIKYVGGTTVGPINIVFAHKNGDFGYAPGVLFPRRKYNVPQGIFPKKGWLKESQWLDNVPPEDLPFVLNP